jgi:hypothetical protein
MNLTVACADVGSVKDGNFGWALRDLPGPLQETPEEASIRELTDAVAGRLREGRSVALGFECPLFIPARSEPEGLTSARDGEGNRPWSAGAGSVSLVTGLAETVWVLSKLRTSLLDEPLVTFEWSEFETAEGALLLWEAFITRDDKAGSHHGDAGAAVESFCQGVPGAEVSGSKASGSRGSSPVDLNCIDEPSVMSLVGMSLLRAGWNVDTDVLSSPCLVIPA